MQIYKLFVYPIKSCAGISLSQLDLTSTGPAYDRQFVLVDERGRFLSQRTMPKLCLVQTNIGDCPFYGIGNQAIYVSAPGMETQYIPLVYGEIVMNADFREREITIHKDTCKGIDLGNEYAEWFSTFLGTKCRLVRQVSQLKRIHRSDHLDRDVPVSFADAYPLLVLSYPSLEDLNERIGQGWIPIDRFRPNIVIVGCKPYEEDDWTILDITGVRLQGANRCVRCVTTVTDQKTGDRGVEPLKTLSTYRKTEKGVVFGRNFVVVRSGVVRQGDKIIAYKNTQ